MISLIKDKLSQAIGQQQIIQKSDVVPQNPFIADLIAPSFIEERPRSMSVANTERVLATVRDYDSRIDLDYCSKLFSPSGTITTICCDPVDRAKLSKDIDNSDARQGLTLVRGGSASDREEAQRVRDHGKAMLRIMGDQNENFFNTLVIEEVLRDDSDEARTAMDNIVSLSAGAQLTLEVLPEKQEQLFFAASPFEVDDRIVFKQGGARPICTSTLGAALPFQDNSLDDGIGTTLGWVEPSRSVARIDMTRTTDDAANCNVAMFGESGAGKTTAALKVCMNEYARGARLFCIDPERLLKIPCANAHGHWINAGGGVKVDKRGRESGACFSPLQPRLGNFSPDEDIESVEDAYASDSADVLAATLSFIHGWAELAWGVAPTDTDLLDRGLIKAYAKYGIDFNTTAADLLDLEEDSYPLMSDVKDAFDELAANAKYDDEAKAYRRFSAKAEQCCEGGVYGSLWARRTNVETTSDFVVFDTYELMEKEDHILTAQMFSILSWIWTQACVSRATGQFMRIFIDEGHLLYNAGKSTSSIAAGYVNMIQKRIRKYNGGLMFLSQNLVDVLSPEVRKQGEAIITSSAYKFFFKTGETDLELLTDIEKFTPTVQDLIGKKFKRGDCLLQAGNRRAQVHIEILGFEDRFLNERL